MAWAPIIIPSMIDDLIAAGGDAAGAGTNTDDDFLFLL